MRNIVLAILLFTCVLLAAQDNGWKLTATDAAARTVAARRSDLNGYFIDDQFLVLFPDAAYLCGTVVLAESVIAPVGVEVHEVGR